jgi:hypothetical protein
VIFSVGFIAAGLPFATSDYGRPIEVCWVEIGNISASIWRFVLFLGPIWTMVIYNCYVYYALIKSVRRVGSQLLERNEDRIEAAVRNLWLYPAVLMVGWLPTSINTVLYYINPGYFNLYLAWIGVGFQSGIGLMNAIVYGISSEVREVICKKVCVRETDSDFEME